MNFSLIDSVAKDTQSKCRHQWKGRNVPVNDYQMTNMKIDFKAATVTKDK